MMLLSIRLYFLLSLILISPIWNAAIADESKANNERMFEDRLATANTLKQTPISMMDFYLYQFNDQLENIKYAPFQEIQMQGEYNTLQAFYSDFLTDDQINFVGPAIVIRGQLFPKSPQATVRKTQAFAIETCERILDALENIADIHFEIYSDLFRTSLYQNDRNPSKVSITKDQLLSLIYLRGRVKYSDEQVWQTCGRNLN